MSVTDMVGRCGIMLIGEKVEWGSLIGRSSFVLFGHWLFWDQSFSLLCLIVLNLVDTCSMSCKWEENMADIRSSGCSMNVVDLVSVCFEV